ncbi:MAG: hypoxanthine phosphoribosyltransferase [Lachnospiraceae bacterium]|nr:hypoxanthine phosphoribosyltransferase [Lachnospiraceae bacterium]
MTEAVRELISEEEIDKRIREMGAQISRDYAGKTIKFVIILKGGCFFGCELAKRLTVPVELDFMAVSSYGNSTESSGVLNVQKDLDDHVIGQDVLVVEDIIDTGRTMSYLLEELKRRGAKSVSLCALLDKPDRRVAEVPIDYCGYRIPDKFVVGYGLDYAQRYRNLPYIGIIEFLEDEE